MFCRFTVGSETEKCRNIDSTITVPTGWFKLTMTYSETDLLKVYFDGTLAIGYPPSCSSSNTADDYNLLVFGRKWVNKNHNNDNRFQVDEFRFWRRILSTSEIANL